jgi:hypothetical protein
MVVDFTLQTFNIRYQRFEPDPTKVIILKLLMNIVKYRFNLFSTNFLFKKSFKSYLGRRTVIAGRFGVGTIFGSNAPFFEFQDQWSP